ncbi:hypothetical protein SAMN04487935_0572 [Flavobacterium noncentrifugens]|uniref:Uncharacterized protein n=1 Tax=Flavobacterium noncentrifugens TaxID=1128970 RepID=A0A1G8SIM9_9FLAO|nr:hypothetical protein SAMN04487935_0572 [Flavobacterium noncentrifugens]
MKTLKLLKIGSYCVLSFMFIVVFSYELLGYNLYELFVVALFWSYINIVIAIVLFFKKRDNNLLLYFLTNLIIVILCWTDFLNFVTVISE